MLGFSGTPCLTLSLVIPSIPLTLHTIHTSSSASFLTLAPLMLSMNSACQKPNSPVAPQSSHLVMALPPPLMLGPEILMLPSPSASPIKACWSYPTYVTNVSISHLLCFSAPSLQSPPSQSPPSSSPYFRLPFFPVSVWRAKTLPRLPTEVTQLFPQPGASPVLSGEESACGAGVTGDASLIPGSGRSPGGGHGNPLQCSCLETSMDRGAWWAVVHGVAKSLT